MPRGLPQIDKQYSTKKRDAYRGSAALETSIPCPRVEEAEVLSRLLELKRYRNRHTPWGSDHLVSGFPENLLTFKHMLPSTCTCPVNV
ncbi:hypothetical protein CEXT_533351 [Caerostris extrusa]|uniref:Uncharacterized protein n=1 Tax=Caerostris extrusa TaxID=172846 RepID=A0AAV4PML8_CAEEX|nr:hypothetical protein CEXT_533351 [Caerostris extrusa]